jgi:hypothetical protein
MVCAAIAGIALYGAIPADAQAPNLNGYTFQVSGTSAVSTDWTYTVVILKETLFNGSNSGSFATLPLAFSQSGTTLTATMDMPLINNGTDPYGQANPGANPLTFTGSINTSNGSFSLSGPISGTMYNEVNSASILGVSDYIYQRYTSGSLTLSGDAEYINNSNSAKLAGLALVLGSVNTNSVQESPSLAGGNTDPTALGSTSCTNCSLTIGGVGLVTTNVANTATWTLSPGTVTPAPPGMLVCASGFAGLAIRRRRRG